MRYLDKRTVQVVVQGFLIGAALAVALMVGASIGQKTGYKEGWKDALRTNPVSEELDLVCAGLWLGEQNKKYFEKENKSGS